MDWNHELEVAIRAARVARAIHLEYSERGFLVEHKSTLSDLVTEADRAAEIAIREILHQAFPGHAVEGEEGGGDGQGDFRWWVDPLDGTVNYAHGMPFYAVSIALEVAGEIRLGVVLDSARDECFYAIRGQGAYLNGRKIQVSQNPHLVPSLVATGFPYDVTNDPENLTYFDRAIRHGLTVRRPGAAALDLAYVAAGRFDAFWELKLKPWDLAAGWLLIEEAGGQVSGWGQEPFQIGNRYLVASNGVLHAPLLTVLRGGS